MAKKLKKFWDRFTMTPMEKELNRAETIYDVENIMKRYSYVHNIRRWVV